MRIIYAPSFLRDLKRLPPLLKEEAKEAIHAFTNRDNHTRLRVHKLKGRLVGQSAFSVNYKYRIVFRYETSDVVRLLAIGDHDVYQG